MRPQSGAHTCSPLVTAATSHVRNMTGMPGYRDLIVWRKAVKFARLCYAHSAKLPRLETRGLKGQIQRSSASVCNNIAEGHGSVTKPETRRYYVMARASAIETQSALDLCVALGFLKEDAVEETISVGDEVTRILWRMCERLAKDEDETEAEEGRGRGQRPKE